jgi:hypothetical protein
MRKCAKVELDRLARTSGGWQRQYGNCAAEMLSHETVCYRCRRPAGATTPDWQSSLDRWLNQWSWSSGWGAGQWREASAASGVSPGAPGGEHAVAGIVAVVDPPGAAEEEKAAMLINCRKRHRGGKRAQKQKKDAEARRPQGGGQSRERSPSDSEEAAAGRSRASGSGAMRHPTAHAMRVLSPRLQTAPHTLVVTAAIYEG